MNTCMYLLSIVILLNSMNRNVSSQVMLPPNQGNCSLNHDGHRLNEGQSVEIRGKLYKVEECGLHRAYHACGTYLLQMVSIACEVLSKQKRDLIDETNNNNRFRKSLKRRYIQRKLLTEACCETLCTVAEMTRYCP